MANKEYEMLFKLGAQLGQGFTRTFNSAQRTLQQTHNKIQELNKLQGDISSYQKQQSGIEKTQKKLDTYKSQLSNTQNALATVRREIEKNGGASAELAEKESDLANKELVLRNRVRDTENALSDKNNKLKQLGQSLDDAGVNTNKLADEAKRLDSEIKALSDTEGKAAREAEQFGNKGADAFQLLGDTLISSGLAIGLSKVYDAFVDCVNVSKEFGATMSTVEALSGATAAEMVELSDEAKRLGAETVFTANEAAQAMTYMGMAGWKAEEMLSGMNGVMSLAAASGEDLGLVSDIVTDNLTAFGLTAKDTAHFADVLAAAATGSNTSVAIMGETFSQSASIAGALGYSIEDVAVAVGLMANAGVKGSVAGTALKNTFNGLLEGATLSAKSIGEVEYTAINTDGTMKSFSQTIDELRVYFDQMTEAERVNNAMAIAGQYGYNGLLAIINATEGDYNSLTASINDCTGAAEKMADIKLDNLQGDITLLDSATDGLKMTVGDLYKNELRALVQVGTDVISGINDFCSKNPQVVKGILAIVGSVGTMLTLYKGFTTAKKALNTLTAIQNTLTLENATATNAATAAQVGLNTAMKANPVGLVITGLGLLTGAILMNANSYEKLIPEVEELTEKSREFNSAMDEANGGYEKTSAEIAANVDVSELYISKLEEIEQQTGGNVAENEEYHNILSLLTRTIPEVAQYIDLETNSIQGGTEALRGYIQAYREKAEEEARQEFINSVYDDYGEVIKEVTENKIKLTQAQMKEQKSLDDMAKAEARMNELYAEAVKEAGSEALATSFLSDEYFELQSKVDEYRIEAGLAKDEQENLTEAIAIGEETISQAKEKVDIATETINQLADANVEASNTSNDMAAAIDSVVSETESLITAYNDAYQAAYSSISGQYALWDEVKEAVPMSVGTINTALDSQIDYWSKYNANLDKLKERTGNIEGLSDVIAGFADGSTESVNAVAGMASASDEQLKQMVANYAKLKEEQEKTSTSLADVRVNFESELDAITAKMGEAVEAMQLDDESRKAAQATIDAYVEAISAGKGKAVDAAQFVSDSVDAALASGGFVVPAAIPTEPKEGYASGTDNAARGIALVGEEGPELVYMHGGEKVVDAKSTRDILGGQSNTITISPQFVINNSGGEIGEVQVSELSERLIANVMDALEQAGIDSRRSAYL